MNYNCLNSNISITIDYIHKVQSMNSGTMSESVNKGKTGMNGTAFGISEAVMKWLEWVLRVCRCLKNAAGDTISSKRPPLRARLKQTPRERGANSS